MKSPFRQRLKKAWRWLRPLLSVAGAAALLLFLFAKIDWAELAASLSALRLGDLLPALLLMLGCDLLLGLKCWLLRPGTPLPVMVGATLSSKFFALLPGGNLIGEAARLLVLRQRLGFQSATSVVILDKQLQMLPAMALCLLGLTRPGVPVHPAFFVLALVVVLWPVVLPGPLFLGPSRRWALRQGERLRRWRWGGPVADQLKTLAAACQALASRPARLALHLLFGLAAELATILMMIWLSGRLHFPVAAWDYLWINGILVVAMVLPLSVMGVGVREGAMAYLLGWWGMDLSLAMSLPLIISSLTIVKGLLYVPVVLLQRRRGGQGGAPGPGEEQAK